MKFTMTANKGFSYLSFLSLLVFSYRLLNFSQFLCMTLFIVSLKLFSYRSGVEDLLIASMDIIKKDNKKDGL